MSNQTSEPSWYNRIVGRSLFSIIFGTFFENKNNAAAIIGIVLVLTLCYVIVFRDKYDYINGLLNILFVVIGYYFGAKKGPSGEEENKVT